MESSIKQKIEIILDAPTCYPEKKRKTREQRYAELVYWYEKYNDVNEVYNLWGMDCTDAAPIDEWLDRGLFRKQRHDVNAFFYPNGSKFPMDYTVIMRDKRMFEAFAEMVLGYGNSYSPSIGYVIEKQFFGKERGGDTDFQSLIYAHESQKLVFKQVFGCSGETVRVVNISDGCVNYNSHCYSPEDFMRLLSADKASNWIIQEFILQHPEMSKLNESSVNTLRYVTFHTGDSVEVIPVVMMRYGVAGALVDNANLGVGVDSSGIVMEDTFSLVQKTRFKCHAAGMHIPYFDEAVSLVKKMHSHIPEIFTVGWDVCITPDGPHLIEGNDGWDVVLHQAFEGCRFRKIYNEMLAKRLSYYGRQMK